MPKILPVQPHTFTNQSSFYLAVGAHYDDIEIMATDGILKGSQSGQHFSAVIVNDGRNSPRSHKLADISDPEMMATREKEQIKAAKIGRYQDLIFLKHQSQDVKDPQNQTLVQELQTIFQNAHADTIYTHNLCDKHPTHVAVSIKVIQALKNLDIKDRPKHLYGVEVWRGLDWLNDRDKVMFDVSEAIDLTTQQLQAFTSQIMGGKRYDSGVIGRRFANATFLESHAVDHAQQLIYAMDLTPLIDASNQEIIPFVKERIRRFEDDVLKIIKNQLQEDQ
jgi:LmbE family N-acetylglucosaminyl deacetylase